MSASFLIQRIVIQFSVMLRWLNLNAGAIEAFFCLLSVAITVVLVVITGRYVALTKKLAEATASLRELRQDEERRWRRQKLKNDVGFLTTALEPLPVSRSRADEIMRGSTRWDDFDFENFTARAAEVSERAGIAAADVRSSMNWMAARRREVEETQGSSGCDWDRFPWAQWAIRLPAAKDALKRISQDMASEP